MYFNKGFNLIELLFVIIIISIFMSLGAAQFIQTDEIQERLFYDQTTSTLRYAKATAVARGCDIQVTISATNITLNERASCKSGAFTALVFDPSTNASGFIKSAPDGITLVSTDSTFVFNALGQIEDGSSNLLSPTVSVNTLTIDLIGETGFVRPNV